MSKIKYRYLFLSFLMAIGTLTNANALTLSRESAEDLIDKMQNVANSRNPAAIKAFFEYYSLPEARFIRTKFELDPNDSEKIISNIGTNLSRAEYIDYLKNWLSEPKKYSYKANLVDFKLNQDGSGLISYQAEEMLLRMYKDDDADAVEKVLVYSNCNITATVPVTEPQIQGLNCVEKIARKRLDFNK